MPLTHNSKRLVVCTGAALMFFVSSASPGFAADAKSGNANAEAPVSATQSAPSISVVAASEKLLVQDLTINGTVFPREEAAVGTDLSGLSVLELHADQGDLVTKGQVLARLDRTVLETQLAQAKASRAQADAAAAQAKAQIVDAKIAVSQTKDAMDRAQSLFDKSAGSKTQAENARYAFESAKAKLETTQKAAVSAEAQLDVMDAQIREVQDKLDKTLVKAPADGLVLSRSADLGAVVSPSGGPLFRIAINDQFELVANVPETELPSLKTGMDVSVELPGFKDPLAGKIRMIAPEIDPQTRLGKVHITLPSNPDVRPGSFARGDIILAKRTTLSVPQSALVYQDDKAFLQVVENDVVHTRPVITGIRDKDSVEIVSGIKAGDTVVARAGTFVSDGDRITPIKSDAIGVN
jgi:HlyD family secretion protein